MGPACFWTPLAARVRKTRAGKRMKYPWSEHSRYAIGSKKMPTMTDAGGWIADAADYPGRFLIIYEKRRQL
jgi:hypothetical protein